MRIRYSWAVSILSCHQKSEWIGPIMLAHAISLSANSACAIFSASSLLDVVVKTIMWLLSNFGSPFLVVRGKSFILIRRTCFKALEVVGGGLNGENNRRSYKRR